MNELQAVMIDSVDIDSISATMQKIKGFQSVIQKSFVSDHDFGVIPGTGNKPTLLKPGAEKICMLLGINPTYEFIDKTEDYKNGFFAYNIKCTLFRHGSPVSQGVGNCNSFEKKYRYINVEEKDIPQAFDKSELQRKTDKYGRVKYKIQNPDIADLVNTILKMAKKRAFIDATLQVASLSDVFTQDIEEIREYVQKEDVAAFQNMKKEDCSKVEISFGKYKGQSLAEVLETDRHYIDWVAKNAKDAYLRKCAEVVLSGAEDEEK